MSVVFEMTKAYLDSIGIRYQTIGEETALLIGIGGLKNKERMEAVVIFDDNDRTLSLKSYNLCQVPEEKKEAIYGICNEINQSYRWVKFYVDEEHNAVTAQDDAIVQADSSGEEVFELIAHMAGIIDEAYPVLMKTIWS